MSDYAKIDCEIERLEKRKAKIERLINLRMEVAHLESNAIRNDGLSREAITVILETVAKAFSIPVGLLTGRSRLEEIVIPRHVIFYLCRSLTSLTFETIGTSIGLRDHGTVLHGCRNIEGKMQVYPEFRDRVNALAAECALKLSELETNKPNETTSLPPAISADRLRQLSLRPNGHDSGRDHAQNGREKLDVL